VCCFRSHAFRLDVVVLVDTGLQPAATFVNCVYVLLKFSQEFRQLVAPLIAVFSRAACESALWQKNAGDPSYYGTLFFRSSFSVAMLLDITPPVNGHSMTCLR
jgi:hypothetical protein